jgi:hypothetical protein
MSNYGSENCSYNDIYRLTHMLIDIAPKTIWTWYIQQHIELYKILNYCVFWTPQNYVQNIFKSSK